MSFAEFLRFRWMNGADLDQRNDNVEPNQPNVPNNIPPDLNDRLLNPIANNRIERQQQPQRRVGGLRVVGGGRQQGGRGIRGRGGIIPHPRRQPELMLRGNIWADEEILYDNDIKDMDKIKIIKPNYDRKEMNRNTNSVTEIHAANSTIKLDSNKLNHAVTDNRPSILTPTPSPRFKLDTKHIVRKDNYASSNLSSNQSSEIQKINHPFEDNDSDSDVIITNDDDDDNNNYFNKKEINIIKGVKSNINVNKIIEQDFIMENDVYDDYIKKMGLDEIDEEDDIDMTIVDAELDNDIKPLNSYKTNYNSNDINYYKQVDRKIVVNNGSSYGDSNETVYGNERSINNEKILHGIDNIEDVGGYRSKYSLNKGMNSESNSNIAVNTNANVTNSTSNDSDENSSFNSDNEADDINNNMIDSNLRMTDRQGKYIGPDESELGRIRREELLKKLKPGNLNNIERDQLFEREMNILNLEAEVARLAENVRRDFNDRQLDINLDEPIGLENVDVLLDDMRNQQADINEELLGRENNGDEDEDEIIEDDVDENFPVGEEADIQIALGDIFGLREMTRNVLKNVLIVLSFNGLYIGIFASLPYMLGNAVMTVIKKSQPIDFYNNNFVTNINKSNNIIALFSKVNQISVASSNALHFKDIYYIGIGYFSLILIIFTLYRIVSVVKKITTYNLVIFLDNSLKSLATITKVGVLLLIRIYVLPVFFGVVILSSVNYIFRYEHMVWVEFISIYLVGAVSFAWTIGMNFMLVVIMSVLQLREVLHPDYLAKVIRPQEPQSDQLSSLMSESGLTHTRRILTSMVVYLLIIAIFILFPSYLIRFGFEYFNIDPSVTVWYGLQELQLPLEIVVTNYTFLSLLDSKKNLIGKIQHKWFVYASNLLGLTRYIIPLPLKSSRYFKDNNGMKGEDNENLFDEDGHPFVDEPLKRPPNGWDARTTRQTTRWAWTDETKSTIEKRLAPRIVPSYCYLRSFLLVLLSWLLVIFMIITLFLLPIFVGKHLFNISQLPLWLKHDPILYVCGVLVIMTVFNSIQKLSNIDVIKTLKAIPYELYRNFVTISFYYLVVEISLGFMYTCFLMDSFYDLFNLNLIITSYVRGSLIFGMIFGLSISNIISRIIIRIDANSPYIQWSQTIHNALFLPIQGFLTNNWEDELNRINILFTNLVHPLFKIFFLKGKYYIIYLYFILTYF
jgi:hypothetical protein